MKKLKKGKERYSKISNNQQKDEKNQVGMSEDVRVVFSEENNPKDG